MEKAIIPRKPPSDKAAVSPHIRAKKRQAFTDIEPGRSKHREKKRKESVAAERRRSETMKKRLDAGILKRHHVRSLLFARRKHAPEPLQPAVAPIASRALRHLPVDHLFSYRLFRKVVRRGNIRFDKPKTLFPPRPLPFRYVDRVLVRRNRSPAARILTTPQDRLPMSLHFPQSNAIRKIVARMNRRKRFPHSFQ